ncbi:MAG: hypothetical protein F7B17_06090 [Desulfurococcales archaeon]|nr:hypothetical protein [Desulfurococcales archaeon]
MSLRVRVIAADSMGVRSIATFVELCGVAIGIDLGASIAPRRFSLPPHPLELKRLEQSLDNARKYIIESDIIVVTHYHYDHYMRDEPELYYGKTVLAKDIKRDINRSQAIRGYRFIVKGGVRDKAKLEYADSREFVFERVRVRFSPPVWHGEEGTKLGKVLMVSLECEEGKIVFASDVQGPPTREAIEWLSREAKDADVIIISGPPSYLAGYKVSLDAVRRGVEGLEEVIVRAAPRVIIVDHHFLRDIRYVELKAEIESRLSRRGLQPRIITAAEYMGKPIEPLEALRKKLWKEEG